MCLVVVDARNGIEVVRAGIGNVYESTLGADQGFFGFPEPGDSAVRPSFGRFRGIYNEILYRPTSGDFIDTMEDGGNYRVSIRTKSITATTGSGTMTLQVTPVTSIGSLGTLTATVNIS